MKELIWWLIAGMKGGVNRAKIIHLLHERPYNANQIAEKLGLDYKTARHHLDVLEKNDIIKAVGGKKYGRMYFLSQLMQRHYETFQEVWEQISDEHGS